MSHQTILDLILVFTYILNNVCEVCLELEWTIIMQVSQNGKGENYMASMHLKRMEDAFPVVHFHASQVGYTPAVKRSNVLNIRNVEK